MLHHAQLQWPWSTSLIFVSSTSKRLLLQDFHPLQILPIYRMCLHVLLADLGSVDDLKSPVPSQAKLASLLYEIAWSLFRLIFRRPTEANVFRSARHEVNYLGQFARV